MYICLSKIGLLPDTTEKSNWYVKLMTKDRKNIKIMTSAPLLTPVKITGGGVFTLFNQIVFSLSIVAASAPLFSFLYTPERFFGNSHSSHILSFKEKSVCGFHPKDTFSFPFLPVTFPEGLCYFRSWREKSEISRYRASCPYRSRFAFLFILYIFNINS